MKKPAATEKSMKKPAATEKAKKVQKIHQKRSRAKSEESSSSSSSSSKGMRRKVMSGWNAMQSLQKICMKKPATTENVMKNVMKKPAGARKRTLAKKVAVKKYNAKYKAKKKEEKAEYEATLAKKKAKKKEVNVKNRARKAAREGKPSYKTRDKKLQKVAESAHSLAQKAINKAEGSDRKADAAICMGLENAQDVEDLQSEATNQKKLLADTRARVLRVEVGLKENQQGMKATTLLAQHNAERLDVDDRKGGYATPKRSIPGQGRVPYQKSTEKKG